MNILKTIPFTATHTYIAHIWQYPPTRYPRCQLLRNVFNCKLLKRRLRGWLFTIWNLCWPFQDSLWGTRSVKIAMKSLIFELFLYFEGKRLANSNFKFWALIPAWGKPLLCTCTLWLNFILIANFIFFVGGFVNVLKDTIRFEEEDDYKNDIWLEGFSRVLKTKSQNVSFYFFVNRKRLFTQLFYWRRLRSQSNKTSNIFPSLGHFP